ncbi:MAG TPA: TauD/TfdA family dioxygenase [Acidimicrobiales bacterium]|nr:TauD/TfdA family dioxygenase [Acidimicrobiales bacterium]
MIEVRPLTPTIGAEVSGIDLGEVPDDVTFAELDKAFLDHKVLFFRDQHITTDQHVAFCRRFGDLEVHPFAPHKPGHPEVMVIRHDEARRGTENNWHSDVTWRLEPSLGSMLRAVEVPAVGGDTLFADMEAAYDALGDSMKAMLDGLVAVHDFARVFGFGKSADELAELREKYPPAEHPVVRTHPVTGRKSIYVNVAFTSHVKGLRRDESRQLLTHLYRQAWVPERQCRFRWEPDSVALWDNRCVQHYAVSDYWPEVRVMERVTIVGDRPR